MSDATDPRLAAARSALDRLGVSEAAEVVRDGLSLLVRADGVLLRVRPRAEEPVAAREVEVARALAEADVPAVRLVEDASQPWTLGASVVTAWAWVEVVGDATSSELGDLARLLHERTVGTHVYDVARFDPLAAIRSAVSAVPLGDPQGDFVRARAHDLAVDWARIADRDPTGTAIVHGDLHTDNVLRGPDGPLLADLELAGAGPASYDTAPAVVAVERYGADPSTLDAFLAAQGHDPRAWYGFATCLAVYELWVTAWAVGVRERSPHLADEADVRVRCLRDGACEPWHLH